jgi:hypothetical protein
MNTFKTVFFTMLAEAKNYIPSISTVSKEIDNTRGTITIRNYTSDTYIYLGRPQNSASWIYQSKGGVIRQPPSVLLPNTVAEFVFNSDLFSGSILFGLSGINSKQSTQLIIAYNSVAQKVQLKCETFPNSSDLQKYFDKKDDWLTVPKKAHGLIDELGVLIEFTAAYGGSRQQNYDLSFYQDFYKEE